MSVYPRSIFQFRKVYRLTEPSVHRLCTAPKDSTSASVSSSQNKPQEPQKSGPDAVGLHHNEKMSILGKKVLVWTKEYPNLESIPDRVLASKVRRSHDKMRVKVACVLTVSFAVLCVLVVGQGKYLRWVGKQQQLDDHTYKAIGIEQSDK